MVAADNGRQKLPRLHVCAQAFEENQRAKRIARALHKQDWCIEGAQNFIAKFCPVAHRAKRVSETNKSINFFFQRHMTSNAATHALANEDYWSSSVLFSRI